MANQVWAEVITIGSELVLGQLVDTNAAYIASSLAEIGIGLAYHTTVGDDRARMKEAIQTAMGRCQAVITTGGIGPTEDDLTREVAAEVMGQELVFRQDLMDFIEGLFQRMGYKMAPNNRRQAYVPAEAEVIHNPRGTAPAFRCEIDDRVLICLPGVPFETEPLIREEILPYLQEKYSPGGRLWVNRVLKVCGVGESNVDSQIKDIIRSSKNPFIGIQASPGEIKIRLTAQAESPEEAEQMLDETEGRLRERIGSLIFGYEDETLPSAVAGLLGGKGMTLSLVDSVTGGQVAAELGRYLGPETIKGALLLPEPAPADEFCRRAIKEFGSDLALAVSGFPEDEGRIKTDIKLLTSDGRGAERTLPLGGTRRIIAQRAATMALYTLFRFLKEGTD